jgi:hypothetical protein
MGDVVVAGNDHVLTRRAQGLAKMQNCVAKAKLIVKPGTRFLAVGEIGGNKRKIAKIGYDRPTFDIEFRYAKRTHRQRLALRKDRRTRITFALGARP